MARKTRKIKRSRSMRKTRQVKRSRRRTRQVKRSRRTRRVKRSRRTRQVKRSRRKGRRVKRSRRKIEGGAFPVIGMAALALLGAGSVAAKKLMDKSKAPKPLTNDDMQRYSDVSSYGHKLQERYEPSATDVTIANSRKRRVEEDAEYERRKAMVAAEERRKAMVAERRTGERKAMVADRRTGERRPVEAKRRPTAEATRTTAEERRKAVEATRTTAEERRKAVEERRKAMVAEEAVEKAAEKARIEANHARRREIYDTAERKRKQDHHDKEQIRIQALISRDLAKKRTREAASTVKRVPVRPTVFKKVKDMSTQEMHDAAYFIAEDQRIKDELAAQQTAENAMSWSLFS